MSDSWFVVQTQPNSEAKANRHLVNQGFATYLPVYLRRVRHARRNEILRRVLFPGYLFVRLDPDLNRWRSINGTVGVRRILTEGDRPRCVSDAIVDEIVTRQDENGVIKIKAKSFVQGQAVRLAGGPFADVSALFEEARDDRRVVLLLSLLGREVRVVTPVEEVVAAA